MKSLKLFLVGLFVFIFIQQGNTQWIELGSGMSLSNHRIWGLSVIDENQVWGISSAYPTLGDHLVKTVDGGTSWSAIPFPIDNGLLAIQIFAADSLNAWLATADELDPISGKIYRTSDGGGSWIAQETAFTGVNETPAAVHFWGLDEGIAFGATCNSNYNDQISIYRTINGGDNWMKVTEDAIPSQLNGEGMCLLSGNNFYDVIGDTIWFATSKNRIFKSADKGLTWEAYDIVLSNGGFVSSFSFKDHLHGIAVASFPNEVLRTTDSGNSWNSITTPVGNYTAEIDYLDGSAGSYIIHNAFFDSDDSNKMFITYDNGDTWDDFISNAELTCIQFISENIGFGGGGVINENLGGVYKWEGIELVSSEEILEEEKINIFPNPTSNYLNIEFFKNHSPLMITVKDYSGKVCLTQAVRNGNSDFTLSVEHLPTGIYSLEVMRKDALVIKKFVKI